MCTPPPPRLLPATVVGSHANPLWCGRTGSTGALECEAHLGLVQSSSAGHGRE